MAELNYNGDIVNQATSRMGEVVEQFSSIISSIEHATSQIISARGFQEYIGGIDVSYFSNAIGECQEAVKVFILNVQQMQAQILSYSQDDKEIQSFLDTLNRLDYKNLDLSGIESHISMGRKADTFFKSLLSDLGVGVLGLGEGVVDLFETGADFLATGGTSVASIFTSIYDKANGTDYTTKMWNQTKAFVSDKKSENLFNSIYSNTEIGRYLKNNAYQYEGVRGVTKGLGYTVGMIGLTALTGGAASGGLVGSVGANSLAATAGVLGVGRGVEEAWSDGATTEKGLAYGVATGAWDAAQWFAGAKINQMGGLGDKIASGIFKGGRSGVGVRIGLDMLDGASEGFVQPALKMIYKDYGEGTLVGNYKAAFEEAGGWGNVGTQAAMAGVMSAVGELSDARKILKSEQQARKVADEYADASVSMGMYSRERTIDGEEIADSPSIFNVTTSDKVPEGFKTFSDGSYLPTEEYTQHGFGAIMAQFEQKVDAHQMDLIIEQYRGSLSAADYTALKNANQLFISNGYEVSPNELKLIAFHSNGNVGRITDLLANYQFISKEENRSFAEQLSSALIDGQSIEKSNRMKLFNAHIDQLYEGRRDYEWLNNNELIGNLDENSFSTRTQLTKEMEKSQIQQLLSTYGISDDSIADQIFNTKGYCANIRSVLESTNLSSSQVDALADALANDVFYHDNMAKMKIIDLIQHRKVDEAFSLTKRVLDPNSNDITPIITDIFRTSDTYFEAGTTKKVGLYLKSHLSPNRELSIASFENNNNLEEVKNLIKTAYDRANLLRGFDEIVVDLGDGHTIPVFVQKGMRASSSDVDFILENIKNYPQGQKELFTELKLYDGNCSLDYLEDNMRVRANGFCVNQGGTSFGSLGSISIFTGGYNNDYVMRHELGHNVDKILTSNIGDLSHSSEWQEAMRLDKIETGVDSITDYGTTNHKEDFAESFTALYNNLSEFQRKCPNRFRLLVRWMQQYRLM